LDKFNNFVTWATIDARRAIKMNCGNNDNNRVNRGNNDNNKMNCGNNDNNIRL